MKFLWLETVKNGQSWCLAVICRKRNAFGMQFHLTVISIFFKTCVKDHRDSSSRLLKRRVWLLCIYRCASNKTDKNLLARFSVLIWSFLVALSLLKSSYFFVERGLRDIFYVKGEKTSRAPFNFPSETCTCSTIGLAVSYKYPTEEFETVDSGM